MFLHNLAIVHEIDSPKNQWEHYRRNSLNLDFHSDLYLLHHRMQCPLGYLGNFCRTNLVQFRKTLLFCVRGVTSYIEQI